MKKSFLCAIVSAFLFVSVSAFARGYSDTVYLKNGSVIKGDIVEHAPGKRVKIETRDGNIFVYPMSDVKQVKFGNGKKGKTEVTSGEKSSFYIDINPLGFVQFGPVLRAGLPVGENTYITVNIRNYALGLMTSAMTMEDADTNIVEQGMGVGLGFTFFTDASRGTDSFYYGGSIEYGWIDTLKDEDEAWEWRTSESMLTILGNAGYRWRWDSVYLNLGVFAGVAYTIDYKWEYTDPGYFENGENGGTDSGSMTPFGMIEVAVGIEF